MPLPAGYSLALRLRDAGLSDELIAECLGIDLWHWVRCWSWRRRSSRLGRLLLQVVTDCDDCWLVEWGAVAGPGVGEVGALVTLGLAKAGEPDSRAANAVLA